MGNCFSINENTQNQNVQIQSSQKTNQTQSSKRTTFDTLNYSLIICRNPKTGKYLAVDESRDRGWWIPGGGIDSGQTFIQGAHRECMEEAGVKIELKGIISMDYQLFEQDEAKMRVIFYAEPVDYDVIPKQKPDKESNGAKWVTLEEFQQFEHIRGGELMEYGNYLENGGQIFPLSMLQINSFNKLDPSDKAFNVQQKQLE